MKQPRVGTTYRLNGIPVRCVVRYTDPAHNLNAVTFEHASGERFRIPWPLPAHLSLVRAG